MSHWEENQDTDLVLPDSEPPLPALLTDRPSLPIFKQDEVLVSDITPQKTVMNFSGTFSSHVHIIGATRYGKSKFVELLTRRKFEDRKNGLILIDPHGSLYDDLVHYLSHSRPGLASRVILFDPAGDTEHLLGFNPIPKNASHPSVVVSDLVSTCLRAWGQDQVNASLSFVLQQKRIHRYSQGRPLDS